MQCYCLQVPRYCCHTLNTRSRVLLQLQLWLLLYTV